MYTLVVHCKWADRLCFFLLTKISTNAGLSLLARLATSSRPLYFTVKEAREVMPTEQPCDLAYEFGDGLLDLQDYPEGFPMPGESTNSLANMQ